MSTSQPTSTQAKNIQEIAHRLEPGKFTKEAATEARQAAEKLFAAHPRSRQLSLLGCLNTIYLFLEAAERNMPGETVMQNWRPWLKVTVTKKYQGTEIQWDGDTPTLLIPDELKAKSAEILEYATDLWLAWGGEMVSLSE